jgi:hypothetical protein
MRRIAAFLVVAALLPGCAGGSSESTPPSSGDGSLQLTVEPAEFWQVTPGQMVVVLASATGGEGEVSISAAISGDASLGPAEVTIESGAVVEFTVVPGENSPGTTLELTVTAQQAGRQVAVNRLLEAIEWPDDLAPLATDLRDRFVAYLEAARPELGITADTEWVGTITKPQILVVMHYLFFSEDWEMGITWHVTVPEHAWSRMYLRARDELVPSIGLEIPSYLDPDSMPSDYPPEPVIDR